MKTDFPFQIVGDANQVLHLTDPAAVFVVQLGNGVYEGDPPAPGPSRAELERQEQERLSEANTLSQVGEEPPAEEAPKMPYGNAPKSAWIRYACAVDSELTQERAEGMTKADLMSRYGERL